MGWRMNKKVGIAELFLISCMLVGCSKDAEISCEEAKASSYYYEIEEKLVPEPEENICGVDAKDVHSFTPLLIGDKVAFRLSVHGDEPGYYLQFWDLHTEGWSNHNVLDSDFEVEGKTYKGINGYIYTSTDEVIYTTAYDEKGVTFLVQIEDEKVSNVICEISEEVEKQWSGKEIDGHLVVDGENEYYFFQESSGTIFCYGDQWKKKELDAGKRVYGIFRDHEKDTLYWYGIGDGNKAALGNLSKKKVVYESIEGLATEYVANVSDGGVLYFADTQNLWRASDGIPQKVYSFAQNGYLLSEIYSMGPADEGKMNLLVQMDGQKYILTIKEVEDQVEKQEITMAFVDRPLALERSVARFNRKNKEFYITIVQPTDGESKEEFRKRMQMEISAGKGPDIYGHDLVYDVRFYAENGYLECVDDVFEDTSLYIPAALKTSEINEHLYGVPFECDFELVYYATSSVGERTELTLEDLIELVKASDAEILQEGYSGASIVYYYGLSDDSNITFIDWERGISHLKEDGFAELLVFAKEYADVDNVEKEAFAMAPLVFEQMYDLKTIFESLKGDACILGYPRETGNGIYINTRSLFLNAGSLVKDGAKEFLKFLVSEQEQYEYAMFDITQQMEDEGVSSISGHMQQFPVSKSTIDLLIKSAWKTNEECFIETDSGLIQISTPYTEEMIEEFYFVIEHAQPKLNRAEVIKDLVYEELEPFFNGDISAEEATDKLHNRVQLYLDETKTGLS